MQARELSSKKYSFLFVYKACLTLRLGILIYRKISYVTTDKDNFFLMWGQQVLFTASSVFKRHGIWLRLYWYLLWITNFIHNGREKVRTQEHFREKLKRYSWNSHGLVSQKWPGKLKFRSIISVYDWSDKLNNRQKSHYCKVTFISVRSGLNKNCNSAQNR